MEKINIKNANFYISAVKQEDYPTGDLPEVVLVGKSNVGKSSFINTMLNRKKLAKTSSEPGKTRQINFYNIDEKMYFVDMPGYGYSKMSKVEEARVAKFINEYLANRRNITLIIQVIDIRHKPSQDDMIMYNYILESNLPFIIVLNKADKIAKTKIEEKITYFKELLGISYSPIFAFSSINKIYNKEIWNLIEENVTNEENKD